LSSVDFVVIARSLITHEPTRANGVGSLYSGAHQGEFRRQSRPRRCRKRCSISACMRSKQQAGRQSRERRVPTERSALIPELPTSTLPATSAFKSLQP
jgi:hypothetical protein